MPKRTFVSFCILAGVVLLLSITSLITYSQHTPVVSISSDIPSAQAVIERIALSPDGTKVVIVQPVQNKEAEIVDTRTGVKILTLPATSELEEKGSFIIKGAKFSPDGNYLLIMGYPAFCALYEVETGKGVYTFFSSIDWHIPQSEFILNAGFTPDGKKYLLHHDNRFYMFETATKKLLNQFSDTDGGASTIEFLPNGRDVIFYSSGPVIVNSETGGLIQKFSNPSFAISPDRNLMSLYDSESNRFELYDLHTLKPILQLQSPPLLSGPMALSNDKKLLIRAFVSSEYMEATPRRLVDIEGMKELFSYPVDINAGKNEPTGTDEKAEFFPDGKRFYTVNGNTVHIWDYSSLVSAVQEMNHY